MRILVLSNFYPPHYIGGYELGCSSVVQALEARGHTVAVLTTTHGVDGPQSQGSVHRLLMRTDLGTCPGFVDNVRHLRRLRRREQNNQAAFHQVVDSFRPDVVYAWNLYAISISLVFAAQERGLPVSYFVSDHWLSRWEEDPWYHQCFYRPRTPAGVVRKALLHQVTGARRAALPASALDLRHTQFASQFLKTAAQAKGKPVDEARVIHWGIDVDCYPYKQTVGLPRKLLYVGQIAPHKGVHTLIEAMNILVREPQARTVQLTIVGGSTFPEYEAQVRKLVRTLFLEENIRFTGMLARDELVSVYQQHDVLLFPSMWEEPFGITPLEAMSSGLAVIGTATGGSPEIFEDGRNALVFPKGDARACARQTARLVQDADLFERVRRNGRRTIEERFTSDRMVDRIEEALLDAVSPAVSAHPVRVHERAKLRSGACDTY